MHQQIGSYGFIAFLIIGYFSNNSFAFKASEIKEIQSGTVGLLCEKLSIPGEDTKQMRKERTWKKCDRIRSVLRKKMLGVVYEGKSEEVTEMSEKKEWATCYKTNYKKNAEILELLRFCKDIPISRVCRIQIFNPITEVGHTWFVIEPTIGEFLFHKPPWTTYFASTKDFEMPDSEFRFDKLILPNVIYFKKLIRLQSLLENQDTSPTTEHGSQVEHNIKNIIEDIFKHEDDNLEESKQTDLITIDDNFNNINDYQGELNENNPAIIGISYKNDETDVEDDSGIKDFNVLKPATLINWIVKK